MKLLFLLFDSLEAKFPSQKKEFREKMINELPTNRYKKRVKLALRQNFQVKFIRCVGIWLLVLLSSCQLPPESWAWISKIPLLWLPASLCLIWCISGKVPEPLVEHNILVLSQGTEPSHISVSATEPSCKQGPSFLLKKLLLESFKCLLLQLNWSRKCSLKLGLT